MNFNQPLSLEAGEYNDDMEKLDQKTKEKGTGCVARLGCFSFIALICLLILIGLMGGIFGQKNEQKVSTHIGFKMTQDTWGCKSKEVFEQLDNLKNDHGAMNSLLRDYIYMDKCTSFDADDEVISKDASGEITKVAKIGAREGYWVYSKLVKSGEIIDDKDKFFEACKRRVIDDESGIDKVNFENSYQDLPYKDEGDMYSIEFFFTAETPEFSLRRFGTSCSGTIHQIRVWSSLD